MADFNELEGCFQKLLSLSISGFSFVGCDIPGFYGYPTDEYKIIFYRLGTWMPFMRAHSHIDFSE